MASGAGSLWNANSWHWEEKSYTKFALKAFKEALESKQPFVCESNSGESDISLELHEAQPGGEAFVSIRKGKIIVALDLRLRASWRRLNSPESQAEQGTIEVKEISVDSIDDGDFWFSISIDDSKGDAAVRAKALQLLKTHGRAAIQSAAASTVEAIKIAESDAERLALDKQLRFNEQNTALLAESQKGIEKQQIAEKQKQLDAAKKQRAAEQQAAAPQKIVPVLEGKGSVWNSSSYHWEEKPMTDWALSTLRERLEGVKIPLLDGAAELHFFNVLVSGEASITIRKARKIVIFDLEAKADWKATCRDEKGVFLADSSGRFELKQFCSEGLEDYSVCTTGDGQLPPQQRIDEAAKSQVPHHINKLLMEFYGDLKNRG